MYKKVWTIVSQGKKGLLQYESPQKRKICIFQFSGNYRGHFPEFTGRKFTGIPEYRNSGINPVPLLIDTWPVVAERRKIP